MKEDRCLRVFPPIHRLGYVGRWIRSKLLSGILHGTPVLLHIQALRTPSANVLMKIVSFLGEEEFYTALVAVLVWLLDARLGRLTTFLMALGFYLASASKNFLCLPRPPSPVIPLERCDGWALPSHHALLSVNVPWYIWFYVYLHFSLPSWALIGLFSLILLWSFLVMFSRMYLGVHSPADILVGGVIGCLLLAVWLHWDLYIDWYIASSSSSSMVIMAIVVLMIIVHPDPMPTSCELVETVCMLGVATGFVFGRAHSSSATLFSAFENRHNYSSVASLLGCCLVRLTVGLFVALVTKTMASILSRSFLYLACQLVGIEAICSKRTSLVTSTKVHYSPSFIVLDQEENAKVPIIQVINLDIPVRFLAYLSLGFSTVSIAPTLFYFLCI